MKRMQINKSLRGVLLILAFFIAGCFYTSKVPIDKPGTSWDNSLLGKWKTSKNSKEYYQIYKGKGKSLYNVDHFKWDRKTKKSYKYESYIAHLSNINNAQFLNMKKVLRGGSAKRKTRAVRANNMKYMFYRIHKKGGGFKADVVTANIDEKFTSSSKLKAFFAKHMGLSFFYNKQQVNFIRVGAAPAVKAKKAPKKKKKKRKWKFKFK